MAKTKLNSHFEREVVERLKSLELSQGISVSDLVANALDALEREQKLPETVVERVENVEENLASLVRLMAVFNEKMDRIAAAFNERMDRASIDEKERLKSLLQLLKSELSNHDQAEQARFERIKPHTF